MTEAEWITGTRPLALLGYLIDERQRGRYPARVFRLFAVAAVRRVDSVWLHRYHVKALEVAEKFARGEATSDELARAERDVHRGRPAPGSQETEFAANCALAVTGVNAAGAAWEAVQLISTAGTPQLLDSLPDLIREVFGNPFRAPALPDGWRAWNRGTVVRLAQQIRDEGRFDEMPVLGDALEEAGCTDTQILEHCRCGTHHVAGCWVLELLLAEE